MVAKDAKAVLEGVWCLICEQRPAVGVMRRVYVDTGVVVAKPGTPQPQVCRMCADKHDRTQAKSASDRLTMWEYREGEDG